MPLRVLTLSYEDHVLGVIAGALLATDRMLAQFTGVPEAAQRLRQTVSRAAYLHDLGKLAAANQRALAAAGRERLPLLHSDAGVQQVLREGDEETAILIKAHHQGLPNVTEERTQRFRAAAVWSTTEAAEEDRRRRQTAADTDAHLDEYWEVHRQLVGLAPLCSAGRLTGLQRRLALACLAEGDYADARGVLPPPPPAEQWRARLAALVAYVDRLSVRNSERLGLRREAFQSCLCGPLHEGWAMCTGATGIGKTILGMVYSLRLAIQYNLRHVFVVLPYVSIIRQSVEIYRQALVLPGEDPAAVVAEHQHTAAYQSADLRYLTHTWQQPIIVTTAVQFFETLVAVRTARLRKLHQLPGSAVFVDEAHSAMPLANWPLALQQLKELVGDWGVHVLLASGTLSRPWEMPRLQNPPLAIPDFLPAALTQRIEERDRQRLTLVWEAQQAWNLTTLLAKLDQAPGPRLVVVNTIQSAAVIADAMQRQGKEVLHLSTALLMEDRQRTIEEVRRRLEKGKGDWTLVATSCVEAGMDFDFLTGFRELATLVAIGQTGGRVNREDRPEWREQARLVLFALQAVEGLLPNPAFRRSSQIVRDMYREGWLTGATMRSASDCATEALRRELADTPVMELQKALRLEKSEAYAKLDAEGLTRVIDDNTTSVIVTPSVIARLERGEQVSAEDLARASVGIWTPKVEKFCLPSTRAGQQELLYWNRPYDGFLGYMRGVL